MQETFVTEPKYISPIVNLKPYMAFLPAVLVAAGIAILSLAEAGAMPSVRISDKLLHGVMYCALAASLMGAFVYVGRARWTYCLLAWTGAAAYGALMEVLQRFCTLTRSGEMADLYADMIGALIGILCVVIFTTLRKNNS